MLEGSTEGVLVDDGRVDWGRHFDFGSSASWRIPHFRDIGLQSKEYQSIASHNLASVVLL